MWYYRNNFTFPFPIALEKSKEPDTVSNERPGIINISCKGWCMGSVTSLGCGLDRTHGFGIQLSVVI